MSSDSIFFKMATGCKSLDLVLLTLAVTYPTAAPLQSRGI